MSGRTDLCTPYQRDSSLASDGLNEFSKATPGAGGGGTADNEMTDFPFSDAEAELLSMGFSQSINEPTIEAGYERFAAVGGKITYSAFCDAVASCLRQGLIREPVRLPAGALQCHWHLELTPDGVNAARGIAAKQRE